MHRTRTALIAGASGLVGSHLLRLILLTDRYSQVISIGRRELPVIHPKLDQQIVDFDNLQKAKSELVADDVFCCLGTTIKKAGSKEAFYKVDHDYVTKLAVVTLEKKATQFLVVSSMGADADSRIFYNKVKGEMERDIRQMGFTAVHIFRPSLLLGEREEHRTGEEISAKIMRPLSALMIGPLRKYRPIQAETVAKAMLEAAAQNQKGDKVYLSDEIERLGS
ncbi:oxidoreductase [Pontibacter sp. JH31]|uniref:Oxidoreductase n=1 Tax=Pontibacter aquaedesilientis TaxID=2766980 RepID=A0ABR7XEJ3_9BACT|nr:oxidoreductase [Pontibacter aquaedesilientis]MBD1396704.1 oxidoreductase [Pontibacter aquaedesilientis]